jgi:hypothetical protein
MSTLDQPRTPPWTLDARVEELNFAPSVRTRILRRFEEAGIETVGDLVSKMESDVLTIKNFGRRCLTAVNDALDGAGFPPLNSYREERERERRLVLAAPEMLAILKGMIETLDYSAFHLRAEALITRIESGK